MTRSIVLPAILIAALACPTVAAAQTAFHYPAPQPGSVEVVRDVAYGGPDSLGLRMDVYSPTQMTGPAPALVLFFVSGAAERTVPFVVGWADAAASNGMVGVYPDLRPGGEGVQLSALLRHLRENAAEYRIDPERIVVYAASGNVSRALPLVEDPAATNVAAAIMYYGTADVAEFRPDLPLLFVRAGLDRPGLNARMDSLVATASAQNAPVWLLNHPAGYHAFEISNDDAATVMIIEQTLDFAHRVTEPGYQSALRDGVAEATAAGAMATGDYAEAARRYGELARARPDEHTLGLAYGEALLASGRFAEACAWFDRLREAPLGFRDRGIPAARSCAGAGNAEAAIAWLASIPPRFRPASLATDPAFEPLQDRADFRALFRPE